MLFSIRVIPQEQAQVPVAAGDGGATFSAPISHQLTPFVLTPDYFQVSTRTKPNSPFHLRNREMGTGEKRQDLPNTSNACTKNKYSATHKSSLTAV